MATTVSSSASHLLCSPHVFCFVMPETLSAYEGLLPPQEAVKEEGWRQRAGWHNAIYFLQLDLPIDIGVSVHRDEAMSLLQSFILCNMQFMPKMGGKQHLHSWWNGALPLQGQGCIDMHMASIIHLHAQWSVSVFFSLFSLCAARSATAFPMEISNALAWYLPSLHTVDHIHNV